MSSFVHALVRSAAWASTDAWCWRISKEQDFPSLAAIRSWVLDLPKTLVLGLTLSPHPRSRSGLSSAMRVHGVGGRGGVLSGHMTEAAPRKPRPGEGAAGGRLSREGSPQAEGTAPARW